MEASFFILHKKPSSASKIEHSQIILCNTEINVEAQCLDLSTLSWLNEEKISSKGVLPGERNVVLNSWNRAFNFVEASVSPPVIGLRSPQLGALHAIQAHWCITDAIATIVMPTGTGKTETMLAITILAKAGRVLVVVPTDALRTQLADKFRSLGVLKAENSRLLAPGSKFPVVASLCRTPKNIDELNQIVEPCNVVITTSSIAARCDESVRKRFSELSPYLFIDEAHHAEAPTWKNFKNEFTKSRVLQFTATPFREDEKYIDGKIVFRYPLAKAQAEDYFRPITFCSVVEFNPQLVDEAIARKALEILERDEKFNHILMARTKDIHRAEVVYKTYQSLTDKPAVLLHSHLSESERVIAKRQLLSGEARIVICVDMLGEGFDLPELKIAAFHDVRKSLAVTLQLAGRFTRSRSDLGNATFIANTAEVSVREELRKLYSQDPDWNRLLPPLSDGAIDDQIAHQDYLEGFTKFPDKFPLGDMSPAASVVLYKTKCTRWNPHAFRDGLHGADSYDEVHVSINERENMLVAVVGKSSLTAWCHLESVRDWTWSMFVLLWDESQKLLFVHGSSNKSEFKSLAIAVAGEDVELVRGAQLFRCFDGFNRLMLTSVGLSEQLGRQVRYTGRMGADVGTGMTDAQKRNSSKALLFGAGYERGFKSTVGASKKGRVWSFQRCDLHSFATWCKFVGKKILDEEIDPNEILKGTLEPELIDKRPESMPILADWPEEIHRNVERVFSAQFDDHDVVPMHLLDIAIFEPSQVGSLKFNVFSDDSYCIFELELFRQDELFDYRIKRISGAELMVWYRGQKLRAEKYFDTYPPVFWFADGSYLDGNQYVKLTSNFPPYDKSKIISWDWTGIDLQKESQRIEKRKDSVQRKVIEMLLLDQSWDIIMDDDDTGESADVVTVKALDEETSNDIEVNFYHCKFSSAANAGARVDDLYVVCGQAQKSISWLYNSEKQTDLFQHLLKRDPRVKNKIGYSRFERGDRNILKKFQEMSRVGKINLKVFIVQPGLKKNEASEHQLNLLAATENYLMETCRIPFGVICSA